MFCLFFIPIPLLVSIWIWNEHDVLVKFIELVIRTSPFDCKRDVQGSALVTQKMFLQKSGKP